MTKSRDVKCEIKDLEITMDKVIQIQVFNSLDSAFVKFLGILSHQAEDKEQLLKLKNLAKSLTKKELQMRNQDKTTANYEKQFTKRRLRVTNAKPEEQRDSSNDILNKCKFCRKKNGLNNYWHLQANCYYCNKTSHIATFCKKKAATRTSFKNIVTYTQSLFCFLQAKYH